MAASDEARSTLLDEILGTYLGGEIFGDTYDDLTMGVSAILPPESLAIITWVAQPGGETIDDRIKRLQLSERAEAFLRRIAALFGPRLSKAFFASDRPAPQRDDWLSFSRQVLQDVESGEYLTTLRLQKFNGEFFTIEGDGNSMLRFARQSLRTLIQIGDAQAFSSRDLERLVQEWKGFWVALGAEEQTQEPAEQPLEPG